MIVQVQQATENGYLLAYLDLLDVLEKFKTSKVGEEILNEFELRKQIREATKFTPSEADLER